MPHRLETLTELWDEGSVGDWVFVEDDTYIAIRLFAGEDGMAIALLPLKPVPERPDWKPWVWDGNRDAPTLEPSILHHSTPKWHGYMRAGKLEVVP